MRKIGFGSGFRKIGFDLSSIVVDPDATIKALFAGGKQGVFYDPSKLSSLWQDAARTIPVTANGDPVGCVDDLSGNGNHAIQTISASRPIYRTDGILHWLQFDGVDDELILTVTLKNNNLASAAIKSLRPINSFIFGDTDGSAKIGLTSGVAFFRLVPNGNAVTAPYVAADKHIITGFRNNGYSSGRLDGVEAKADSSNATAGTTWKTLGSSNSSGQYHLGSIYGVVMVDGYSVDKLSQVEKYLAAKAGVTL